MIRLAAPEWLGVLLLLVAAAIFWPRLGLRQPLRAGMGLLVVLLLVRPEMRVRGAGLDLWVLVDHSASAAEGMARRLSEWETLLEGSRGPEDHIHYVGFAAGATRRENFEGGRFPGDTSLTQTGHAIRYALSAMDTSRAGRLLLLTDGYSTEPLSDLSERLREQAVPLDYRRLPVAADVDASVAALRLPTRASVGEAFLVELEIRASADGPVPYEVLRDDRSLVRATAQVEGGVARLRFSDRVSAGGAHRYEARVAAQPDAFPGNDAALRWIDVAAGPRILCITTYADDPVVTVLRARGLEVEAIAPAPDLDAGRLAGARAVVLDDVAAHRLSSAFLEALDFYVREQGGGLLMLGGRDSFGAGGYFESPIDALLPVSMELREEHRKLVVAMAIVMDRSGSMGMLAGAGGRRGRTKMELANEGAARSIELLGDRDRIVVYAVDSLAHEIVGLTEVGPERAEIQRFVRRIDSRGGGIFVYTGLEAAWRELERSELGQRHVVLFADAADAEEPGAYRELLREMVAADTTVSVIGLGRESDSDADFLKDIATRGGGRIFFTNDAATLPALFAQETVALARSSFVEEPARVVDAGAWLEIAARPVAWPARVDGYNLSYLRPGASVAARTADEDAAPLVAFWQRGVGRVAAVSFPLSGEFSGTARGWPGYGDFVQTLARWLMGPDLPRGIGLETRVRGTRLEIDLRLAPELDADAARTPPRIVLSRSESDAVEEIVWEREAPGWFRATTELGVDGFARGAVQTPQGTLPFGPVNTTRAVEWSFDPRRLAELAALAHETGGQERLDLETIWSAPRTPQFQDVTRWLLLLLLALLLVDTLRDRVRAP